jgi:hypothetical protein
MNSFKDNSPTKLSRGTNDSMADKKGEQELHGSLADLRPTNLLSSAGNNNNRKSFSEFMKQ